MRNVTWPEMAQFIEDYPRRLERVVVEPPLVTFCDPELDAVVACYSGTEPPCQFQIRA